MTAHIGRDEDLVATDQWLHALRQFRDDGLDMLDFLTGVDRGEHIEIVARLTSSSQPSTSCFARTTVPVGGGVLPCACDIYPGAAWHERETSEMFAITIASGEHPPLLLHDQGQRGALLKARLLQFVMPAKIMSLI